MRKLPFQDVSKEMLPGYSRGGYFHEKNDPGYRTVMSRIFSISNNVENLMHTPEVRAIIANRQTAVQFNLSNQQTFPTEKLGSSAVTPEDIMSQPQPSETLEQPQGQKSIEEIRMIISEEALPIGSRGGVPQDVAQSIEGANDERLALGA